jgi:protein TonB
MNRNIATVISVVLLHLGALWALHTGLLHRLASIIVPAQVLIQISPAPSNAPDTKPEPQVKPQAKLLQKNAQKVPLAQAGLAQEAPKTIAPTLPITSPTEQPSTLAAAQATPQPAATASAALSSTAPSTAPYIAPAPPKVELPSSDADYLNNPKPHYPPMSKRLGEQGKVVVRTLIGADGTAQQAEIKQSSGFERLDQAALATALRWRYVPGKRAGVAQAMWFNVPFQFLLE